MSKIQDIRGQYADDDIIQAAATIADERFIRDSGTLSSPSAVRGYLRDRMRPLQHEEFMVIFLDNHHKVIDARAMFRGTIDSASVYPREVAREVLTRGAAAVIIAHNHPSGNPTPSNADRTITERLTEALALIDCRVLDHLIVADQEVISMVETGDM